MNAMKRIFRNEYKNLGLNLAIITVLFFIMFLIVNEKPVSLFRDGYSLLIIVIGILSGVSYFYRDFKLYIRSGLTRDTIIKYIIYYHIQIAFIISAIVTLSNFNNKAIHYGIRTEIGNMSLGFNLANSFVYNFIFIVFTMQISLLLVSLFYSQSSNKHKGKLKFFRPGLLGGIIGFIVSAGFSIEDIVSSFMIKSPITVIIMALSIVIIYKVNRIMVMDLDVR